jgi:hypothetical protein
MVMNVDLMVTNEEMILTIVEGFGSGTFQVNATF